jgi:RNA polymerase sigma factor (sigma-70 family)
MPDIAEREALLAALASLNPDQRIVIVFRFYLDLPLEAIAERTGAPLGTVKTRLHHGVRRMRAAYDAAERAGAEP